MILLFKHLIQQLGILEILYFPLQGKAPGSLYPGSLAVSSELARHSTHERQ